MTDVEVRPGGSPRRRNVGLKDLPPIAQEVATEQGIDPRTHGRKDHADFNRDWVRAVKELRLLQRPSPEDEEIRRALRDAGEPTHSTARSNPLPMDWVDETSSIVHVITDLPPVALPPST